MDTKRDRKEYLRAWRKANPEKTTQYTQKWRANNIDAYLQQADKYNEKVCNKRKLASITKKNAYRSTFAAKKQTGEIMRLANKGRSITDIALFLSIPMSQVSAIINNSEAK